MSGGHWDLSGYSHIDDDAIFEQEFIETLGGIIEKKYRVFVYEIEDMESKNKQ